MLRIGIREFTKPDRFEQLFEVVTKTGERIEVTRAGKPVLVLMRKDDYDELVHTVSTLLNDVLPPAEPSSD